MHNKQPSFSQLRRSVTIAASTLSRGFSPRLISYNTLISREIMDTPDQLRIAARISRRHLWLPVIARAAFAIYGLMLIIGGSNEQTINASLPALWRDA